MYLVDHLSDGRIVLSGHSLSSQPHRRAQDHGHIVEPLNIEPQLGQHLCLFQRGARDNMQSVVKQHSDHLSSLLPRTGPALQGNDVS